MRKQMYIISEAKLLELLEMKHELACLNAGGVDNWSWYMENRREYINETLGYESQETDFGDCAIMDLINYTKLEV